MPSIEELVSNKYNPLQEHTTTYRVFDGDKHVDYPLPQSHNITQLCNDITQLQKQLRFLPIVLSGKSESGKSTFIRTIIHRISCQGKPEDRRIIQWFKGKEIFNMKEIIAALPKNKKYAIVLDDQSFVIDQAAPRQKKELMEYFTVMRKDLGDEKKYECLFFTAMHYGRAMSPMLRDGYLRILTSMSDEDKKTWNEGFGYEGQHALKIFQKQFASQMQNGYFFVNLKGGDTSYKYHTDAPFRIALIKDLKGIRPILYPKEECELCHIKEKMTNKSPVNLKNQKQKLIEKNPSLSRYEEVE